MPFLIPHSETEFQAKLFQVLTELCISTLLQCFHVNLLLGTCFCMCPWIYIYFVLTLKANSLLKLVHAAFVLMNSLGLPR